MLEGVNEACPEGRGALGFACGQEGLAAADHFLLKIDFEPGGRQKIEGGEAYLRA